MIYPTLSPRTGTDDAPVDNPITGEFLWTRAANRFGWDAMRAGQDMTCERVGHFAPALAADVAGLPPTFIAVGALDLFLEQDVAYALRLSRAGMPVEAHVYPGGVHGFDGFPGALSNGFQADLRAAITRLAASARRSSSETLHGWSNTAFTLEWDRMIGAFDSAIIWRNA